MVVHNQISTGGRAADSAPVRTLPPGQVIEAKVVSSLDNGLTRVAIGKSTVDLPLPPGLQSGETVHLQARGSGANQTLVLHTGATNAGAKAAPAVAEGKVLAVLDNGLTRVAVGKTVVDLPLRPGLQPGQTIQISAQGNQSSQSLSQFGQTTVTSQTLAAGTTADARVVSLTDSGLTRVAIGKTTVDVSLPPGLQAGQTIRLHAQGSGAEQRLLPVVQSTNADPVLKPGQIANAKVLTQTEAGITRLAIGKSVVTVSPSLSLTPGQALQVQGIGSGPNQSLAILNQGGASGQAPTTLAEAKVLAVLDNGLTRVSVGKTTVDIALPPGLRPGQSLNLQSTGLGGLAAADSNQKPVLALQGVTPGLPLSAAANMVLSAVGRQDGMSALFANLSALKQNGPSLPQTVEDATLRLLNARVDITGRPPTGQTLQQAIMRSGVFLEGLLAKGNAALTSAGPQAGTGGDLKSALLNLTSSLEQWLGRDAKAAILRSGDRLKPPVRGSLPQAQSPTSPTLPDGASAKEAGRLILAQAEAALARVRLAQLSSLGDSVHRTGGTQQSAPGEWNTEVPLLLGNETGMAQFQIQRDGGNAGADGARGWQMRFSIDFEATGGVHAKVTLKAGRVGVMLWADRQETSRALAENMTDLAEALEAIGLKVGAIHTRNGEPKESKPPVGAFMDRTT